MGYLKSLHEEADARGWTSPGDRYVCPACIEEEALRAYITSEADESRCDYCGREESGKRIGAHIDLLVERIAESLPFEWGDPNEELPYDSGEGGYQGEHIGAEEVLYREECG